MMCKNLKKRYVFKLFSVMAFWVLLFTGCGVPDQALVLLPEEEQLAEVSAETDSVQKPTEIAECTKKETIFVHVCGAVVKPGVVELPKESRAVDALEAAGGLREDALSDYVNLASLLTDGQQLYFPTEEEADKLQQLEQQTVGGLININTARAELLCTLPGIGEARAGDIIAYRKANGSFESTEDIMKVPGIKQSAYAKLRDLITVDGS